MRVKVFSRLDRGESIDEDINAWLADNPGVQIRGTELSTHLIADPRGLPDLAAVCLVMYDEA